jgi:hypothetical protein
MNKILWMADEVIAETHPQDWERISRLSRELFSTIGANGFNHEVVLPQECIGKLAQELFPHKFSAVIDLTGGWLGESLRPIMRSTPLIKDFHLSRVRDISDPSLGTTGHVVSLSPPQILDLKKQFDFSRTLILDDVSFSGLSSRVTMEQFHLNPEQTTHGFLILNVGELGPNKGARSSLEILGSKTHGGRLMNTSEGDDGWHIKDFIENRNLGLILRPALHLQEIFAEEGKGSLRARQIFTDNRFRQICFPDVKNLMDLKKLAETSQFIFNPRHEAKPESLHARNPNLLISPAVFEHLSLQKLQENFDHISEIMLSMRRLSFDQELSSESIRGLKETVAKETEGMTIHPERSL